jgi:hypothetical protein
MKAIAILALAAVIASIFIPATAQSGGKMTAEQAREENAYTLGVQAFLWDFRCNITAPWRPVR